MLLQLRRLAATLGTCALIALGLTSPSTVTAPDVGTAPQAAAR